MTDVANCCAPQSGNGSGPTVSIVVPVYNAASFIEATVASVCAQTFSTWELILVDDGSRDASLDMCRGYAEHDPRIRVLTQANAGPSAARNTGVRAAVGEFVMFLDADDCLYRDALEVLVKAATDTGTDMAVGNFSKQEDDKAPQPQPVVFAPDGEPFCDSRKILSGMALIDYVRHFLLSPSNHLVSYCWARLYRLSVIRKHNLVADESMRLFEDFAFNLDYLAHTGNLVFVNTPVYIYVLRPRHMSASMALFDAQQLTADMQQFRCKVSNFLGALRVPESIAGAVHREVGHTLIHYAIIFLVRAARQINRHNLRTVLTEIRRLVAAPVLKDSLPDYVPRPGNSRMLPWLMRLDLAWLIAITGWIKGNQRYGRLKRINHVTT